MPLGIDVEDQSAIYNIVVSDVFGRNVLIHKNAMSGINTSLAEWSRTASCGMYFLKVEDVAKKSVEVFKLIKQ